MPVDGVRALVALLAIGAVASFVVLISLEVGLVAFAWRLLM